MNDEDENSSIEAYGRWVASNAPADLSAKDVDRILSVQLATIEAIYDTHKIIRKLARDLYSTGLVRYGTFTLEIMRAEKSISEASDVGKDLLEDLKNRAEARAKE